MLFVPYLVALVAAKNIGVLNFSFNTTNQPASVKLVKRDSDGTLLAELTNEQTFYSLPLKFGSNTDEVTVLIDTGSSDLWVSDSSNPYCKSSSTSKRDFIDTDKYSSEYPSNDDLHLINKRLRILDDYESFQRNIHPDKTLVKKDSTAPYDTAVATATMDCSLYGTFDSSGSDSLVSNNTAFYVSYADGTFAYGTWVRDSIVMSGTTIEDMNFGLANKSDSEMSVLGIGLESLESTNVGYFSSGNAYKYANLPRKLVQDGLINRRAYSLYLNEASASSGSILFGGIDNSKFDGDLNLVPLVNTYYGTYDSPIRFEITVTNISVTLDDTETSYLSQAYYATLDSGSTYSYFPSDLLTVIASTLSLTYSSSQSVYYMTCPSSDDNTTINFDFQGFKLSLSLSDFLISDSSSNYCVFTILENSSGITLGDNFLRHLYVVYDLDNYQIALAPVVYTDDEDIEVITDDIPNATKVPNYDKTMDVEGIYYSKYGSYASTSTISTASPTSKSSTKSSSKASSSVSSSSASSSSLSSSSAASSSVPSSSASSNSVSSTSVSSVSVSSTSKASLTASTSSSESTLTTSTSSTATASSSATTSANFANANRSNLFKLFMIISMNLIL